MGLCKRIDPFVLARREGKIFQRYDSSSPRAFSEWGRGNAQSLMAFMAAVAAHVFGVVAAYGCTRVLLGLPGLHQIAFRFAPKLFFSRENQL